MPTILFQNVKAKVKIGERKRRGERRDCALNIKKLFTTLTIPRRGGEPQQQQVNKSKYS